MVNTANCHNKSDQELVTLTLQDQENFVCIVERYQAALLRYIHRISNLSSEEAEDVLQDIFIKIYTNLNDFDQSLKFSSWVYRITHNQVISNFRRNKARPQSVDLEIESEHIMSLASKLDLEKEVDGVYLREAIEKVLSEMDIKYREVLILKFLEEKSYKEISDILKKPMGTIATLVNRAKGKFRDETKRHDVKLQYDR